jgi:phage terminase small subunit
MALTQKQEAFCLAYIETGNASEAYRRCYSAGRMKPESVNREAKSLLDNPKITARLDELRGPVVDAAKVTLEGHLKRLSELSKAAEGEGKYAAAVTAEIARGKVAGLYVEKTEVSGPNGGPVQNMSVTPQQLAEAVRSVRDEF